MILQLFTGSFLLSPAFGWAGQGRLNKNDFPPPKNFWAKLKRADEKGRDLSVIPINEFFPAPSGGGKRLVFASAKRQSPQKLFP
jgi:hypothetical protein